MNYYPLKENPAISDRELTFAMQNTIKYLYYIDILYIKVEVRIIKLSEYSIEHLINHDI